MGQKSVALSHQGFGDLVTAVVAGDTDRVPSNSCLLLSVPLRGGPQGKPRRGLFLAGVAATPSRLMCHRKCVVLNAPLGTGTRPAQTGPLLCVDGETEAQWAPPQSRGRAGAEPGPSHGCVGAPVTPGATRRRGGGPSRLSPAGPVRDDPSSAGAAGSLGPG